MQQNARSSLPLLIILWGASAFFLCFEIIQLLRPADFTMPADLSGLGNPLLLGITTLALLLITHLNSGLNGLQRLFHLSALAAAILYLSLLASDLKLTWWFACAAFNFFWLCTYAGLWLFLNQYRKILAAWFCLQGLLLLYLLIDRYFYLVTKVHLGLVHLWRWQNTAVEETGLTVQNTLPLIMNIGAFLLITLMIGIAMPRAFRTKRKSSLIALAVALQLGCMLFQFNHIIENRPFEEYLLARFDASGLRLPLPASMQTLRESGLEISSFTLNPDNFYVNASFTWNTHKRPNIIFLTLESIRANEIEQNMPLLMQWAGKGIYFSKHFSASNITETSLNSIYGSMYPFFLTEQFHKIKPWSFTQFLQNASYQLTRVYCKWSGLYNEAFYRNFTKISVPEPTTSDPLLHALPLEWFLEVSDYQLDKLAHSSRDVLSVVMKKAESQQRYFIEGYLFNGHFNYSYPPEFAVHQPTLPERFMIHDLEPTTENLLKLKNRYRNALGFLDHSLNQFLTEFYQKKLNENTYIVIYGDHGQSLGESGFFAHVSGPHIFQFQVPCVILGPGLEPQLFDGISQNLDLVSTLGEIIGYTASGTSGRNLFREQREFSLEQDNSVQNRFIMRRNKFMSIYEVDPDRRVRWIITIGNQFELNDHILALYKQPGLANLKQIIAEDFRQIAREGRLL